jgi:myo-inositol 2-dehydrogenase / D-chiro-inositol 1-dehydrogenase
LNFLQPWAIIATVAQPNITGCVPLDLPMCPTSNPLQSIPMNRPDRNEPTFSRRQLLGSAAAATSVSLLGGANVLAADPAGQRPKQKIKLGWVGCGGRGQWLMPLFLQHGGYELHAVADYFPQVAEEAGNKFGVAKNRRFSGLSGYKKLIDSQVDAMLIEDVPYFYPEQAQAAVEAGLHVYMAKPVAVDVPGCLAIGAAAKQATRKQRCFLVDYQLPYDPACIEVATRVREGALGKLAHVASFGLAWQAWPDPPLGKNIENRLRNEIWLSDTALSGDTIVSYDIHIIDGIVWLLGQRPTSACGRSRICRTDPHGDRTDAASVIYELPDGAIWTHVTQSINNNIDLTTLSVSFCGMQATAHLTYGGKSYVRGGTKHYSGSSGDIYKEGAVKNIDSFHKNIVEGHYENLSAQRAVDGTLTAILGREAAARHCFLTMDDLIKENKRLAVNLEGMQA